MGAYCFDMSSGCRSQRGGMTNWMRSSTGLRRRAASTVALEYLVPESSDMGMPESRIRDQPPTGARVPSGKGCRRYLPICWMWLYGMSPLKTYTKLLVCAAQRPNRRGMSDLASLRVSWTEVTIPSADL